MSTIYDVAELAGVSAKTVSRVLNDDPAVKGPTRDRVRDAMTRLDYRPNSQARSLRKGDNKSVGMLLEDPAGGYQGRFHHAMLVASMETRNHLAIELFTPGRTDFPREDIAHFVADAQIKAMVLLPPLCDYGPLKSFLKDQGIHCVLISPTTPDDHYPSVNMDDRKAARDVTDYLLSLGHRRIAHIAGHPDHAAAFLRRQGFNEAFDAIGAPRPSKDYVAEGLFNFKSGIEAAEKLLSLKERPTAIFAANDEMAAATCSVAHKMGLRIPEDLSVIGFDDAPIASAVWPALTTVRQPYLDMAKRTLQILNAAGDAPHRSDVQERHIIPHELVIRESTGPAPAA